MAHHWTEVGSEDIIWLREQLEAQTKKCLLLEKLQSGKTLRSKNLYGARKGVVAIAKLLDTLLVQASTPPTLPNKDNKKEGG